MKFLDRIDITPILSSHVNTLYDHGLLTLKGKQKMPFSDKFTFLYLPATLTIILIFIFKLFISENYLNIIITSLSIFVGLLFGLLTLVFELLQNEKIAEKKPNAIIYQNLKFKLVQEIFINIAFSIALSIISIIVVLITQFNPTPVVEKLQKLNFYKQIKLFYLYATNSIAIFLLLLFITTLLMILKRFFIIFTNDFYTNNINQTP